MDGLINVYKPYSATPLEVVKKAKKELKIEESSKVAYAGRLDPMASGVLLLMIGNECKNRDSHQNYHKRYRFKVLLGLSTDTLDPMGKIVKIDDARPEVTKDKINSILADLTGDLEIMYPLYSSYRINGKPMFLLARRGELRDSGRPTKIIKINRLSLLSLEDLSTSKLRDLFIDRIRSVNGDFRQAQIIAQWKDSELPDTLLSLEIEADVSSGTYVRSVAEEIGKKLSVSTLAFDIIRTSVGEFKIKDSLRV